MNLYFLVEGKSTERKIYPCWLSYLLPSYRQVKDPSLVDHNNYFLISAEGYPSILNPHLQNAIRDVENIGKYDLLIVILDADEDTVLERIDQVIKAEEGSEVRLSNTRLEVIVQNRCIETWLLGNRKIVSKQPRSNELINFIRYYDVTQRDPEKMPLDQNFRSHGQFHYQYLQSIFREKDMIYSKRNPGHACDEAYLFQLNRRVNNQPDDMKSFSRLLYLIDEIKVASGED